MTIHKKLLKRTIKK